MTDERKPTRRVRLAILDGYKVRWDRHTVARDIVQNFYDEVADFDDVTIDVDVAEKRVRVSGPSTFKMDYLRYVGATTKRGRRTAGGFGEGFKIAALVMLRDYDVTLRAGAADWEIEARLVPMKLGRELCYDVFRRVGKHRRAGSFVEIRGADAALCDAFVQSRDLFFHPRNPRVARVLHASKRAGVGVYFALDAKRGDLFYRRQNRGRLRFPKGAALTFACDDAVEGIEADRDRRAVQDVGRVVAAVLARMPVGVLEKIIAHLRPYWTTGNGVLRAAIVEGARRGLRLKFSKRWLAKSRGYEAHSLEQLAARRGFLLAGTAFESIGMEAASKRFHLADKARVPTAAEAARIQLALEIYKFLTGEVLERRGVRVIEARARIYTSKYAIVPAAALASPFQEGIGIVLRALVRLPGDARASNADRLTKLIEGLLREAGRLGTFAQRWEVASTARGVSEPEGDDDPFETDEAFWSAGRHAVVRIFAPAGFPPTIEIARRIRDLASARRIRVRFIESNVATPRMAAESCARGIPSIWIGRCEVDPDGPPRFALRTFRTSRGRSLVPSARALTAALEKGAERSHRRSARFARLERDEGHLLRWLRDNDVEAYRQRLIDTACVKAIAALFAQPALPRYDVRFRLARVLTALKVADAPWSETKLDALAAEHASDARAWVLAFAAQCEADSDFDEVGAMLESLIESGAARDKAAAEALSRIPLLRALDAIEESLPLDSACKQACVGAARSLLLEPAFADPAALLAAMNARLRAAVDLALERHARFEAGDDDAACDAFDTALCARLGIPDVGGEVAAERVRFAACVADAWADAIRRGASPLDAAQRCLETAQREYRVVPAPGTVRA